MDVRLILFFLILFFQCECLRFHVNVNMENWSLCSHVIHFSIYRIKVKESSLLQTSEYDIFITKTYLMKRNFTQELSPGTVIPLCGIVLIDNK